MGQFFAIVYTFFSRQRIVLFSLLILMMGSVIFLGTRIRFEEDISDMTPGKADQKQQLIAAYRFPDKVILLIEAKDPGVDPELLSDYADTLISSLRHTLQPKFIRDIGSMPPDSITLQLYDLVYDHLPVFLKEEDYDRIDTLLKPENIQRTLQAQAKMLLSPAGFMVKKNIVKDPLNLTLMGLEKFRNLQAGDGFKAFNGYIFSEDDQNLLVFITPVHGINETSQNTDMLEEIGRISESLSQGRFSGIQCSPYGPVVIAVSNATQLKKDIMLTVTVAIILIMAFVGWYFRNRRIRLVGFLPAIFGAFTALSVIYLVRGHISAIALGIGAVILGMIIDYTVYLLNQYRTNRDVALTLREMSQTVFLCALTSIAAFSCLLFLTSAVLQDLGIFASITIAGSAFFALVFMPHFLPFIIGKPKIQGETKPHPIDRLLSYRLDQSLGAVLILLGIVIASFFTFRNVTFEKDMHQLGYMDEKLQSTEEKLNRINNQMSLKIIYVLAYDKNLDRAITSNLAISGVAEDLQKAGIISRQRLPGTILPPATIQKEKIRQWETFWNEEKVKSLQKNLSATAKQLKIKPEAFEGFFRHLTAPCTPLDSQAQTFLIRNILPDQIQKTREGWLIASSLNVDVSNKPRVYQALDEVDGVVVFDRQILTDRMVESVRSDFERLVNLCLIFVTIVLIISFGRFGLGLIAAIPMFLSWIVTLGFMNITGISFNIFNIIICSFIFGLGVDYSILMVRSLMNNYKYSYHDLHPYRVSIFISAVTTIIGSAALLLAKHPALRSIALPAVVGLTSTILITYTFPAIVLRWFMLDRKKIRKFPVTLWVFMKTIKSWGSITLLIILLDVIGILLFGFVPVKKSRKKIWFHHIYQYANKLYIFIIFPRVRKIDNPSGEDFSRPAVIICNHQSLTDVPSLFRLYPKIIILTNNWVYNSPLFGPICRFADFPDATNGIDDIIPELQKKIDQGFSIIVFPEGTRSQTLKIQRFHKGAFYLADKFKLDILPVMIYGTGHFLRKGDFFGKPGRNIMRIFPRIPYDHSAFGSTYAAKAKALRKFYIHEYQQLSRETLQPYYIKKRIYYNYVLKGPVLEWYFRIKTWLSDNYRQLLELVPEECTVTDIGCGYGFITYALANHSDKRMIHAIDHDKEKIEVAQNCYSKTAATSFVCAGALTHPFERSDVFILSDILHYLPEEDQQQLLLKCFSNLHDHGRVIIRDANKDAQKRHLMTRLTEYFSTRSGFNKTKDPSKKLFFTSFSAIRDFAQMHGFQCRIIEKSSFTSNMTLVIEKDQP